MKEQKKNGFYKFVCFVIIAILLLLILGIAVGSANQNNAPGGSLNDDLDSSNNSSQSGPNNESLNTDRPVDDNPAPTPSTPEEPKHYSPITGLEISKEIQSATPYAFCLDPVYPLYGISSSDLIIEIPLEENSTRLLCYFSDYSALWKIGALAPSRAYISSLTSFFGGIVVSYSNDDVIIYDAWETETVSLDLSKISECHYKENTLYIYTSESMIDLANAKNQIKDNASPYKEAPFIFSDSGSVEGTSSAQTVIIPYSEKYGTELYYNKTTESYLYFKSANRKVDMLNGSNVSFKNVFILFTDTVTYETSEGTELVPKFKNGGKGYYISEGGLTEFKWSVEPTGNLIFKTLSNEVLTVNRGNSYIAYYKSSSINDVVII